MSERTTRQEVADLSCDQVAAHAFAERYLLSGLNEPERDAYERHFLDCERCFHELTTVRATRTELSAASLADIGTPQGSQRNWWPAWLGVAAVIVLGAGLWTMWFPRETRPTRTSSATLPQTTPAAPIQAAPGPPAPAAPPVSLAALARFDPPPYEAPVLRGSEDEARKLFRSAMTDYLAGAHEQAIKGLRSAARKDPRAADAGFFLGVSLLLTKQTQAGIAELKRTIALGDSPYLEESHFYLAKGLLLMGDVSAASRELRAMIALGGDREREAKQLLSQVERARKER
jgi:tetratricopeptide (TPR) repeat protein